MTTLPVLPKPQGRTLQPAVSGPPRGGLCLSVRCVPPAQNLQLFPVTCVMKSKLPAGPENTFHKTSAKHT
jgi:hypothetical protein